MDVWVAAYWAEAFFVAAVGVLLLLRGRRSLATWMLLGLTLSFAGMLALHGVRGTWPGLLTIPWVVPVTAMSISAFGAGFVVAYPPRPLSLRARWLVVWVTLPAVVFAVAFVWVPHLVRPGLLSGLLLVLYGTVRHLASLLVFGAWWLLARDGPMRTQMAYVLVAFLLWAVNDGMPHAAGWSESSSLLGRAIDVLTLAVAVLIGGVAAWRVWRGHRGDLLVAVTPVAAFGLSWIQYFGPYHMLVDGLFYAVLVYGFAKYQLLDVDVRVKQGVARSFVAVLALVALVVVEEVVQDWVGGRFGFFAGIAVAVLVAVAPPLHRLGRSLGERLLPGARRTEDYLTRRRIELYRAAVEGSARNGRLEPQVEGVLAALRRELSVSDAEHEAALADSGVKAA